MSKVTCESVRDALLAGRPSADPELAEHARICEACAALLAGDAPVGLALAGEVAPAAAPPWSGLEALMKEEVGVRAWFRSRSNPWRLLFAGAAFTTVTALGLVHLRSDFALVPALELALLLATFGLVGGMAGRRALPIVGNPSVAASGGVAVLVAALGVPAVAAFVRTATRLAPHAHGATFLRQAWSCFSYGALLALPLIAVLWLLDRGAGPRSRVFYAAGTAGLAANAALTLHCPNAGANHLLLGHATIGLAFVAAAWLFRRRVS